MSAAFPAYRPHILNPLKHPLHPSEAMVIRRKRNRVPQESMYVRIGGGPAVKAAVDQLYELILDDRQLEPYFTADGEDKVDMTALKKHMAALLTKVLDGPDAYTGRDLGAAHRGLGITSEHFGLVADYLEATLLMLHVPRDIVAHVMDTVGSLRDQIVQARAGV